MNNSLQTKQLDKNVLNNIKRFDTKSQLQRAIYFFIINNLTAKDDKAELTEIFKQLDTNKDGVISKDELLDGFQRANIAGLTQNDVEQLIDKIDGNKSKTIDYTEFLAAAIDKKKVLNSEQIKKAFSIFDKDNNGKISPSEFKNIFKGVTGVDEQLWVEMIKEVDTDGNGEIDFKEFHEILMKLIN